MSKKNINSEFRFLTRVNAVLPCVLFCLLYAFGQDKPLLIMGEGSASVRGAFSYDFLRSPLQKPFKHSEGRIDINVPFNFSKPLHTTLQEVSGDFLVMPEFTASVQQNINASIDISTPIFEGAAFFSIRENASLCIEGALGNANINLDSLGAEDGNTVVLQGGLNIPLKFSMHWRTMTFGYTIQPTRKIRIGFQLHKHMFTANTSGNIRTSLAGRIKQTTDGNVISIDIIYPEDKVYGQVEGLYEGTAWVPEIGFKFGPLSLVSRMGLTIAAKGELLSEYSIPFFLDGETLAPKFTETDSFLSPENLPRLLNAETQFNGYYIKDNLHIQIPQSHTFKLDFFDERLAVSYTKTFGRLETYTTENRSDTGHFTIQTGQFLNSSIAADHITILSTRLGVLQNNIGFCAFDVGYRDNRHIYSEWMEEMNISFPMLPIWNFGFLFGHTSMMSLKFFIAPVPAVRTGFYYAF